MVVYLWHGHEVGSIINLDGCTWQITHKSDKTLIGSPSIVQFTVEKIKDGYITDGEKKEFLDNPETAS